MMFFKVIYYLIGLLIVGYKMFRIGDKNFNGDLFEVFRWHEKEKEKGNENIWNDMKEKMGPELRNGILYFVGFTLLEITWLGIGLFTYNWLLFIAIFLYAFIFSKVMMNSMKKYKSVFIKLVNLNLFIGIVTILFAIVNTFHLHIDLFKLIFGG